RPPARRARRPRAHSTTGAAHASLCPHPSWFSSWSHPRRAGGGRPAQYTDASITVKCCALLCAKAPGVRHTPIAVRAPSYATHPVLDKPPATPAGARGRLARDALAVAPCACESGATGGCTGRPARPQWRGCGRRTSAEQREGGVIGITPWVRILPILSPG